ncbi:NADH-quinone oxidoreductase chain 2 [Rhodobacteraceae bacterium THAF1]|uniref:NADH-quinone oxidoreductase subunit E n=1 Tax=Palleronia sp. THAF1 TaxID=2587842 RepID=UPI000F3D8CEE|nr:NADH-quinone oxidoreductase subunit E [Palleronia sp. THAF1]QFU08347.1 NADH-quinone oxidoreductase chain 2 [Palleronia sp. THAF1]VDC29015.1 NADH-quinone oxidoreductase chain 2 [Rhodobacteraceae bacterium THAF1]
MLRRLHPEQPDSFVFTEENRKWAEGQISKFPEGRQASAIIPLLWRAQEQEGWLSRKAIEHVAGMLDLAYIRALEVATFYFMFQLQPVGSVAHIQICGTTSCMICGAEDLVAVCKDKIAKKPHALSDDGKFSWEEVECLGACANAPMAQIGKDYYEDLTAEGFAQLLDEMAAGKVPQPGSQAGRFASEPAGGITSLTDIEKVNGYNASVTLAEEIGDTLKRIDGTEVPLRTPWRPVEDSAAAAPPDVNDDLLPPKAPIKGETPDQKGFAEVGNGAVSRQAAEADDAARPNEGEVVGDAIPEGGHDKPMSDAHHGAGESTTDISEDSRETSAHSGSGPSDTAHGTDANNAAAADVPEGEETKPAMLDEARDNRPDDLKRIKGIGPALERMLNEMGVYHFDQIAGWAAKELAWVDRNLEGFKGRATRDNWIGQAKGLAQDGQTNT